VGRFLSPDPIGFAGGVNRYRYASNNPVGQWDPTGEENDPAPSSSPDPSDKTEAPTSGGGDPLQIGQPNPTEDHPISIGLGPGTGGPSALPGGGNGGAGPLEQLAGLVLSGLQRLFGGGSDG